MPKVRKNTTSKKRNNVGTPGPGMVLSGDSDALFPGLSALGIGEWVGYDIIHYI